MITLFRTKFKLRISYKSGNSQEVWFTKFSIKDDLYTWKSTGSVTPLDLGVDDIESVYQIGTRVNWLRALGIVTGEL